MTIISREAGSENVITASASAGNGDGAQKISLKALLASRVPFDIWPDDVFLSEPVSAETLRDPAQNLAAGFVGDWEIIPGIDINEIGLDYKDGQNKELTLTSTLRFFQGTGDEIRLDLLAEYQKEDDTTTLLFAANTDPKTKIPLGALVDELLKKTGLGLPLPDALHKLEVGNLDVELTIAHQETTDEVIDDQGQATFEITRQTSRLLSIGFTIGSSAGDWEVIPGFLSLQPAWINLTLGNGAVQVEIQDSITLLGVNWLLDVQLPSLRGRLEMAGGKGEDDGYLLKDLFDHFHLPTEELGNARLSAAGVFFDAQARVVMLHLELKDPWKMGHLEIKDVQFELDYQGGQDGGFAAQFSAAIDITVENKDPIEVQLSAEHLGPGLGWQAAGSTGSGQEIAIGDLLIDLGKKFGIAADHPAALESLVFENLHASFNSATKDFTFKGEADFEIDDTPVVLEVSIAITHHSDGQAQKRFSGVITFTTDQEATHEFDVLFANDTIKLAGAEQVEVSTLLAAYRSTAGDPPNMQDLVPAAYKKLVPNIKTRGAFLARQSKKSANGQASSKWLIGLSLEAGLDLSNVKLPSLPLMGSSGPPTSLKLDLQILVPVPTVEAFDDAEMGIIGKMNVSGGVNVPSQAVEGVAVATVLLMDGRTVRLNLPIRANADSPDGRLNTDAARPAFVDHPSATSAAESSVAIAPNADSTKWVKIQKNFGPIHVERVGLKYEDEKLFIYLDGGLTAAGFTVSLEGLGVDTPLTNFDPHFHLSGIGLSYQGGGVELGGAFMKQEMTDPTTGEQYTAYSGQAVLKTEQLSLSAIGSYFKHRGETSLFIYALLDYPLGGPPFFFVTGLAAGFGYNRRAIIPPVEQIHTYPLVTKAIAGPAPKSSTAAVVKPDLAAELAALAAFVPPELGEIFLAVGVKFTSFELIDSFGLVIAQFGVHNQFDLVGVSHLQIPSKEAGGKPGSLLAEIYMNWKAVFRPDEGVVGLKAVLAPGSYVFSPDCHLTGGFAYYAWFGGSNAGDFVYTVGGYHPEFKKPDHYPLVDPLTFNWVLSKANLHLKGQLYYALTGHAFMAGGRLDASMHGGFDIGIAGVSFSADLHIAADFLITWEPFHYDAAVSLALHIEISAHLLFFSKHFSLDVGADMHIWGPEFAGKAHIYLKIWKISHTLEVTFGAGPPKLRPITWEKFHLAFLPKKADQSPDPHAICGVSVKRGLIRASGERWVVNAKELSLVTDSMIPINRAQRGGTVLVSGTRFSDPNGEGAAKAYVIADDFGIAPMGVHPDDLTTVHTITITRDGDPAEDFFRCEPVFKKVPAAMWDGPRFTDTTEAFLQKPEINPERQLVSGVLGGLEVLPAVLLHPSESMPVERGELLYETDRIADAYEWEPIPLFVADEDAGWQKVNDTILKRKPSKDEPAGPAQAWAVREAILADLGLGQVQISFGQPANQYVLHAPQIEMA